MISRTVIQTIAFQSTPPARGATITSRESGKQWTISIHAPREGGDIGILKIWTNGLLFQSTPPARGATLAFR